MMYTAGLFMPPSLRGAQRRSNPLVARPAVIASGSRAAIHLGANGLLRFARNDTRMVIARSQRRRGNPTGLLRFARNDAWVLSLRGAEGDAAIQSSHRARGDSPSQNLTQPNRLCTNSHYS